MTTALIIIPLAAAVILWVLPLNRVSAGSIGLLAALAEVGIWIQVVVRFDFSKSGLQFEQHHSWFSDLNVSYHVGFYAFSVWLVGLTVVVTAAIAARVDRLPEREVEALGSRQGRARKPAGEREEQFRSTAESLERGSYGGHDRGVGVDQDVVHLLAADRAERHDRAAAPIASRAKPMRCFQMS